MFSEIFSLKGAVILTGISSAIKGLQSLARKFKDTGEEIDDANRKLSKSLESEFRKQAAAADHLLLGFRKLGKATLNNKVNYDKVADSLNSYTKRMRENNAAVKASGARKQLAATQHLIQGYRELGNATLRNKKEFGTTRLALNELTKSFTAKSKATQRSAALTNLAAAAERDYYRDILKTQAAQARTASNRRAEIMGKERDYMRSLSPAQRRTLLRNTEPEYNPRGANAKAAGAEEKNKNSEMRHLQNMQRREQARNNAAQNEAMRRTQEAQSREQAQNRAKAADAERRLREYNKRDYAANIRPGNTQQGPMLPPHMRGPGGPRDPMGPRMGPPGTPPTPPRNPFGPAFSSGLGSARKGLASFGGMFSGIMRDFRLFAVMDIWQTFTKGIRSAITLAKDYNQAMADLQSVTKQTDAEMAGVSDQIRTMYRRTGVATDPVEIAKGLKSSFALGYTDVKDAMAVAEQAKRLSQLGGLEFEKANELLGSVMLAYGAKAQEAEKYANILLSSTDLGSITMEQYATSIGRVLPFAVQAGVAVDELSAIVGVTTQGALRGQVAITGLGEAIEKFAGVNRTQEAQDLMEQLGLGNINAEMIKAKGLPKLIKEIADAADANNMDKLSVFSILAGTKSGGRSLLAALDADGGLDKLNAGLKTVRAGAKDEGGTMDLRQPIAMKGADAQLKLFMSLIKDAGLQLTEALAPAFASLMTRLNGELRPVLDNIISSLKVLMQGFTSLFSSGSGKDGLKGALYSIRDAIVSATGMLAQFKLAATYFTNTARILFNVVTLIAKGLASALHSLAVGLSNPFSTDWMAVQDEWKKSMQTDIKDINTAWSNMFNAGDQWQKDANKIDGMLAGVNQKVKAAATETSRAVADIFAKTNDAVAAALTGKAPKSDADRERDKMRDEYASKNFVPRKTDFDSLTAQEKRHVLNNSGKAGDTKLRGMVERQIIGQPVQPQMSGAANGAAFAFTKRQQDISTLRSRQKYLDTTGENEHPTEKKNVKEQLEKLIKLQNQQNQDLEYSIMSKDAGYIKAKQAELDAKNKALAPVSTKKRGPADEAKGLGATDEDMPGTSTAPINFKESIKDLKHKTKIGEIGATEALEKWKDLLAVAREHGADLTITRKIESEILTLTTKITKEKEKQARIDKKAKEKAANETLADLKHRVKMGETTAEDGAKELQGLIKETKDPGQKRKLETELLNMNRTDKKSKQEKMALDVESQLAENNGVSTKASELAALDADFKKYDKFEGDKTRIKELYAKKRLEIEEKYALEESQLRQDILSQTAENQAEIYRAKGENEKAELLLQQSSNAQRYLDLQAQVQAWRDKGASELEITKFIESEQQRILAESKKKKDDIEKGITGPQSISGKAADPRYAASTPEDGDDGNTTFTLGSFGIGGKGTEDPDGKGTTRKGAGRRIDRKANDLAKKQASEQARLAHSLKSTLKGKGLGIDTLGSTAGSALGSIGGKIGSKLDDPKSQLDINLRINGKEAMKATASRENPKLAFTDNNLGGFG